MRRAASWFLPTPIRASRFDDVVAATGWPLKVADDLSETARAPTADELAALRGLHERTAAARALAG